MAVPLTDRSEVQARLGRPLTPIEEERFDAVVADVSAFLMSVAPRIPKVEPVPSAVVGVASNLVVGVLTTPVEAAGVAQESLGGYSVQYRSSSGGLELTKVMSSILAPWLRGGVHSAPIDPGGAAVVGAR